jgi:phosphopantothenoylcysteine decarboxylase / phosphopantothenate---cysteine ligase
MERRVIPAHFVKLRYCIPDTLRSVLLATGAPQRPKPQTYHGRDPKLFFVRDALTTFLIGLSYCEQQVILMTDWPHLQDIVGTESQDLQGKLIGIAVCGSVAAIEIHKVARQLMRHGAKIQFFLTRAATELVSPTSLSWCTGRPVVDKLTARCEHLEFFGECGSADLLLVAPVTANTLAKMAMGLDDNVVTTCITTALGTGIPVMCAPGMHAPMMENPAVVRNLEIIRKLGIHILVPSLVEGKQKMMGSQEIVARVSRTMGGEELKGKRVLITGGPTREFLDPARCLTNPSSGLTACLLAEEAYRRGADVRLVYGPGKVEPESWISTVRVETGAEMLEAVQESVEEASPDIVVAAAAVCDFAPAHYSQEKRSTGEGGWEVSLEPTPKVIRWIRENCRASLMVAFKAVSGRQDAELAKASEPYLRENRADLVVANSVVEPGSGFETPTNRYLVCRTGAEPLVLGPDSKKRLSGLLWSEFTLALNRTSPSS